MPVLHVGDVLQVLTYTSQDGQNGLNVSYWKVLTLPNAATTDADVASKLAGLFAPALKGVMSDKGRYDGLTVQVTYPTAYDRVVNKVGAGLGSTVSDPLPNQMAGLIRLRTGVAGRANRGRKFVAFPPVSYNNSSGDPSTDYKLALSGIGAIYTGLLSVDHAGAPGATLRAGRWQPDTLSFLQWSAAEVHDKWSTMRTRAENRGGDPPL